MCLHVFRFGLPCGNQVKNSVYIWNSNWGKVSPEKFRNMLLFTQKKNLFKRISLKKVTSSIAGAGFEPYDLRAMRFHYKCNYRERSRMRLWWGRWAWIFEEKRTIFRMPCGKGRWAGVRLGCKYIFVFASNKLMESEAVFSKEYYWILHIHLIFLCI